MKPKKNMFSKIPVRYIAAVLILILVALIYNSAMKVVSSSQGSHNYVATGYGILFPLCLLVVLAIILISPGDPLAKTISNFVYAIRTGPSVKSYSKAEAALAKGLHAEAIKEYEAILEKDPGDIDARLRIAYIYCYKLKEYEQAIREYHKVFTKEPDRNPATFALQEIVYICVNILHNPRLATTELQKIIDNFPDSLYAYRAKAYMEELAEQLS